MDKQKSATPKLSNLRTFATDKNREEGGSAPVATIKEELVTSVPTPTVPVPTPKVTLPPVAKAEIVEEPKTENIPPKTSFPKTSKKVITIREDIVDTAKKEIPKPPVFKSNRTEISITENNEDAGPATIITDTKKERFKLFPAIGESLKNWLGNYKIARQKKNAPKYTVPETTRRKGVIQKATSQTGKTTTSDHENIQERIKHRKENEEKVIPKITEKEKIVNQEPHWESVSEPKVIWTPDTETVFPLIEIDTENKQNPQPKNFLTDQNEIVIKDLKSDKQTIFNRKDTTDKNREEGGSAPVATIKEELVTSVPTPTVPVPTPKVTLPPVAKAEIVEEPKTETGFHSEIVEEPAKYTPPITSVPTKTPTSTPIPTSVKKEITPPNNTEISPRKEVGTNKPKLNKNNFLFTSTNILSFLMVLMIFVVIGGIYFWSTTKPKITISPINNYPKIIEAEMKLIYQPITDKGDFINRIKSEYKNSDYEFNQFIFTTNDDNYNAIKPSALLQFIDINLNANFSQSISRVYFGKARDQKPFIAFKVVDLTTARGGMLVWEETMRKDLQEIFELPQTETKTEFTDAMLSGIDVRILKNELNEEELIYGFIDYSTVIITNSSTNFGELLTLTEK